MSWAGTRFEIVLGKPGHGGFCVGRHEGRVVFVRHGLPGERVVAEVTEDRGGGFCRADAVEIVDASTDRVPALCPVSGPGGAGCCDFSHASLAAQRALKAAVVAEQLERVGGVQRDVTVEDVPGTGNGGGWRTRLRLAVDDTGRAGVHGYRSAAVITDLRCPQPLSAAVSGLAQGTFTPRAELQIAVDARGERHVVEVDAAQVSKTGRRSPGRRGATARRAAVSAPRSRRVVDGSGRAVEDVAGRTWTVDAAGFWQAHRGAAQAYSDCIAAWAVPGGASAWDLYSGAGVFAARLAEQAGSVVAIESARAAVTDGRRALADLEHVEFRTGRVEQEIGALAGNPATVVLDPPRTGAGRVVVEAVAARAPQRIIHIGCDPASFARDVALYAEHGYRLDQMRAFDAFPLTHHVEVVGLFVR